MAPGSGRLYAAALLDPQPPAPPIDPFVTATRPAPRGRRCEGGRPGFRGPSPHRFRRGNIAWPQQVGGSAIDASRIAGRAEAQVTSEYTFVAMQRQQELTRRIQEQLKSGAAKVEAQREAEAAAQAEAEAQAVAPGADDWERFMHWLYGHDNGKKP